jgi:hypothetical protein
LKYLPPLRRNSLLFSTGAILEGRWRSRFRRFVLRPHGWQPGHSGGHHQKGHGGKAVKVVGDHGVGGFMKSYLTGWFRLK